MQSKWAKNDVINSILATLMPANRLICEVCLANGLRVGDCLSIKSEQIRQGRFVIKEQKTNKTKRVYINTALQTRILAQAGRIYAFEHRTDYKRHRTRHALYNDLVRANKAFRIKGVTTHSMRKSYAVEHFKSSGYDIKKVQGLLNHTSEAVTMIYAIADKISPV